MGDTFYPRTGCRATAEFKSLGLCQVECVGCLCNAVRTEKKIINWTERNQSADNKFK